MQAGGKQLARWPFEKMQMDFIELPQSGLWKYCLVMVDHLTGWVEAFPTRRANAGVVAKKLLEEIIPRFSLPGVIDTDRGTHFTGQVVQQVAEALGIEWSLHTPWHPQSSGRTERMNQSVKQLLRKQVIEFKLPWPKALPAVLYALRTKPRAGLGLSPFELMYGFGLRDTTVITGALHQIGSTELREHILALSSVLSSNRKRGILHQTPPLESPVHQFQPGDEVLIKVWNPKPLEPLWNGPEPVLLTTETSVRTGRYGWTHHSRVKRAPVERWQGLEVEGEPLKLKLIKQKGK